MSYNGRLGSWGGDMSPMTYKQEKTHVLTGWNEEYKFVVIDVNEPKEIGRYKSIEAAKSAARKALRESRSFYIFQLVSKVSPKPIDADVEDF